MVDSLVGAWGQWYSRWEDVPMRQAPRPDLGPKQLAWCEQHLGHFKRYKDQADKAAAESEQQRRELGW